MVCRKWALVGSAESVAPDEIARVRTDLERPVYAVCPSLPVGVAGFDLGDQRPENLPRDIELAVQILQREQDVICQLGEENPGREEWWRTRDAGAFKIWAARNRRLLLYPSAANVYGFSITSGADQGYFFFRSKSCREEGRVWKEGQYKMSDHALPAGQKVSNLDLLFSDGTVLLLRLRPTGAGFKVFPRRMPGIEGSLE